MRSLKLRSDIELLRLARSGEPEAFACLYRRYQEAVTAYLIRRTRRPEVAIDLALESFTAALVALHKDDFDEPDEPVAWLFAIARNKLIDAWRRGEVEDRARREAGLQPLVLYDSDLERIDALTDEDRVLGLLERLPVEQREAVRAHILEDRDYPEIAVEADTSQMVVRQRVSRGLRRLREMLEANS